MIIEYFSLGKGPFTGPRGRLEKSLLLNLKKLNFSPSFLLIYLIIKSIDEIIFMYIFFYKKKLHRNIITNDFKQNGRYL